MWVVGWFGGFVVALWWLCGGFVVVLWWFCGGFVVVLWWFCGGFVVVLLNIIVEAFSLV